MSLNSLTSHIFIIPLIIIIVRFNKLTYIQQLIAIVVVVAGITECTAFEMAKRGFYNTPVLHFFVVIELALYSWIFHTAMPNRFTKKVALTLVGVFTILAILNTIFLQSLMEFSSNSRALESLILIILSLTYFYHLLQEMKVFDLHKLPPFWVSAGVLINFSTNLLFFSFMDWLMDHHLNVFKIALSIHAIANMILYLLLANALSVNPAKAKMN